MAKDWGEGLKNILNEKTDMQNVDSLCQKSKLWIRYFMILQYFQYNLIKQISIIHQKTFFKCQAGVVYKPHGNRLFH